MMLRQRMKTKTGCERCKKRRVKCDEGRPRCSFCARWNLECVWPMDLTHVQAEASDAVHMDNDTSAVTSGGSTLASDINSLVRIPYPMSGLSFFRSLPNASLEDVLEIEESFQNMVMRDMHSVLPFGDNTLVQHLNRAWLEAASSDLAVYHSLVAYCTRVRSIQTRRRFPSRISLESEARSIALLRERIERGTAVTGRTIQAAMIQFALIAHERPDPLLMQTAMRGINALIRAGGGYEGVMRQCGDDVRLYLVRFDTCDALFNTKLPFFQTIPLPSKPSSLESMYLYPNTFNGFSCFDPVVQQVAQEMGTVLEFLPPSRHKHSWSLNELLYLLDLFEWIDCRLNILQATYAGTYSLSEIAVLAMVLIRLNITKIHHPSPIVDVILERLRFAIAACQSSTHEEYPIIVMWASVIGLVGSAQTSERNWPREVVTSMLGQRYDGSTWPSSWKEEVGKDIRRLLWHQSIEDEYLVLCSSL